MPGRDSDSSSPASSNISLTATQKIQREALGSPIKQLIRGRQFEYPGQTPPKWQPGRFFLNNVASIQAHFRSPPPLEEINTAVKSKEDKFNDIYATHMAENELSPVFKDNMDVFQMGFREGIARDGKGMHSSYKAMEVQKNAHGQPEIRDAGPRCAGSGGTVRCQSLPRVPAKKARFDDGDRLTVWTDETYRRVGSDGTRSRRSSGLKSALLAANVQPHNIRAPSSGTTIVSPNYQRVFSGGNRILNPAHNASNQLLHAHPGPNDYLERLTLKTVNEPRGTPSMASTHASEPKLLPTIWEPDKAQILDDDTERDYEMLPQDLNGSSNPKSIASAIKIKKILNKPVTSQSIWNPIMPKNKPCLVVLEEELSEVVAQARKTQSTEQRKATEDTVKKSAVQSVPELLIEIFGYGVAGAVFFVLIVNIASSKARV